MGSVFVGVSNNNKKIMNKSVLLLQRLSWRHNLSLYIAHSDFIAHDSSRGERQKNYMLLKKLCMRVCLCVCVSCVACLYRSTIMYCTALSFPQAKLFIDSPVCRKRADIDMLVTYTIKLCFVFDSTKKRKHTQLYACVYIHIIYTCFMCSN